MRHSEQLMNWNIECLEGELRINKELDYACHIEEKMRSGDIKY